ncbi:MAG: hypothetical protein K1W13_10245 [Lachnospiraceae bacterium]
MITLQNKSLACDFDDVTGRLTQIRRGSLTLPFCGLAFDFGCNEKMATGLLQYESMLDFRTWNLPAIQPTGRTFSLIPKEILKEEDALHITYELAHTVVKLSFALYQNSLKTDITITNRTDAPLYLNGCAFVLGLDRISDVTFDYPANTPIVHCEASQLKPLEPVSTGLINFATHTSLPEGDFNLLFIDGTEKWGCGTYRDDTATHYVYNAGLEADLAGGASLSVGSLYLLPCAPEDGNPYLQIRDFTEGLGFLPHTDGVHTGVMYSCHPAGTMDSNFPRKDDLFAYADSLPALKAMGIDHVWLLPVFEHNENGVYHSNDQSVIDERYGGEAGCKYYCDKAHALGMTVLFDYVPHGPAPDFPVAKDNPEWPSKRRDGSLQDEWECVSMDYNHPGYQEYTAALVHDHVKRFGVDGARIDCAMGGLSNWRPYGNNRPSGNSVLAGVHITEAIRNGFLRGGKPSFILPENFNPLPNYYHCTDIFYGMNLYRAFVELEPLLQTAPASYAAQLTDFLEREALITPAAYRKLRFLGNHDTVSWVWQSKRAVDCYGTGGAKALFALISFIDGVPMLYQGDEDPSLYGGSGENLTAYFTALFRHRKQHLPAGSNTTTYLHTGTPLMAFIREPGTDDSVSAAYDCLGSGRVLVLINLSDKEEQYPLPAAARFLAGSSDTTELSAVAPYGYKLFSITEEL